MVSIKNYEFPPYPIYSTLLSPTPCYMLLFRQYTVSKKTQHFKQTNKQLASQAKTSGGHNTNFSYMYVIWRSVTIHFWQKLRATKRTLLGQTRYTDCSYSTHNERVYRIRSWSCKTGKLTMKRNYLAGLWISITQMVTPWNTFPVNHYADLIWKITTTTTTTTIT